MASERRVGADVKGAVAIAALLMIVGLAVGDTWVGIGLSFLVMPLLLYAAAKLPIRHSLFALMFLVLILPNPQEGIPTDTWDPPLVLLGKFLLNHLNTYDHTVSLLASVSISGMDLCLLSLGGIVLYRNSNGSKIDSAGRLPTPEPLLKLAWLSLGATGFMWFWGIITGGDFGKSLWQVNAVMYTPLVFLLFQYALRGPKDHATFAKVLLTAGAYKALLAVWVHHYIPGLQYATSHADSILFADSTLLLLALLLERQKVKLWAALLLPVLGAGMVANNRRLVWVQVTLVLVTVYIVSKDNRVKRFIRRTLTFGSPLAVVYVVAGWGSQAGSLFKPVRMLRSVVDAKSDASSFWRELENFNLLSNFRDNIILGSGYGHPYREYVMMPDVDYPLEHFLPHNSILSLWVYGGLVGYAGLTLLWAGGVYFAMRAYRNVDNGADRAAALISFGAVLVWLMMCWGDLGVGLWAGVFTVAPAFAVAGKLAVSAGQWNPRKNKRAKPAQVHVVDATSPPA